MEDYGGFDDNLFDDIDQGNDNGPENGDDALDNVIRKVEADVKPKRKINTKPQPKLTERELTGEKGLCALRKLFENYQPNEKKSPYDNLEDVMQKVEYWGHLLFPKATFDDFLTRVENVGKKRAVKVYMTKLRHGMPLFEDEATAGSTANPNHVDQRSRSPSLRRSPSVDSFDNDDMIWDSIEPTKAPEEIDYEAEWAAAEAEKAAASTDTVSKPVESKKSPSPLSENDSESEQITYNQPKKTPKTKKRRVLALQRGSDDDSDDNSKSPGKASFKKGSPDNSDAEKEPSPEPRKSLKARNRRLVIDSDEEVALNNDSDEDTASKKPANPSPKDKTAIESDSDNDSPTSEAPENVPPAVNSPNPVKRRKVIIDSDDDEPMAIA